ncbi:MAG: CHAT domain-containing tetratricopeptide repeat protein [Bacteroidota bacterium]
MSPIFFKIKAFAIVVIFASFTGTSLAQLDTAGIMKDFNAADLAWEDPKLCLNLTLEVIPKLKMIDSLEKYAYALNTLSYCYNHLEQYETMLRNNMEVLEEIDSILGSDHLEYVKALNNIALAYKIHGDFARAKTFYQEAVNKAREISKDANLLATAYMNIGNLYRAVGDNDLALNYFLSSQPLMEEFYESKLSKSIISFQRLASLYTLIGKIYASTLKNQEAGLYYKKAYDIVNKNPKISQYLRNSTFINLSEFYIHKEEFKSANDLIDQVLNSSKLLNASVQSNVFKLKGRLIEKGFLEGNSFDFYHKSYSTLPENKISEKADILLHMFNSNSELFMPNYFDTLISTINSLSPEDQLDKKFRLNITLTKHFDTSCDSILLFILNNEQILNEIIKGYSSNISKYTFLKKANEAYNSLIELFYETSSICKQQNDFKEVLFHLIENNKAITYHLDKILLENESSDTELKNLRRGIILVSDKIKKHSDSKNIFLRTELLKLKELYHEKYTSLFSSIDITKTPRVNELKVRLAELRSSYSTYFATSDFTYIYTLNSDTSYIDKIEINSQLADRLLKGLIAEKDGLVDSLLEIQKLLLPKDHDLNQIISLDSWLHFWPFSLSQLAYHNLPIQRVFSSKEVMIDKKVVTNSTIRYLSPNYTKRTRLKDDFVFSLDVKSEEYNKWFNTINSNDVLHFSGHSSSYDNIYGSPVIYLEDSTLKISDLYNQRLINELFVLSSCEGQIGAEISGEGINNLTRSLSIIGAKSTISTLWSVNHRSTSKILNYFYENIISGQSKSLALANAKRSFLESCRDYQKHPYYWAGIVLTGDNNPVNFSIKRSSFNISTILISSLILFLVIIFVLKRFT